jgi:8-oxo-dGTP diphosphatase
MPYTYDYPMSALATDIIVRYNDKILMIRRKNDPFKGKLALPGGFVNPNERFKDAAVRELKEETSVEVNIDELEFVGILDCPDRDSRGRVVSAVYRVDLSAEPLAAAQDDAESLQWCPVSQSRLNTSDIAFDHASVIVRCFPRFFDGVFANEY